MKNNTKISFDRFKAGKFVTTLMIDPNREKGGHFKRPPLPREGKLFAHTIAMESCDIDPPIETLDEVSTSTQFHSLILKILAGRYGIRRKSTKPCIVMVTIHFLEG